MDSRPSSAPTYVIVYVHDDPVVFPMLTPPRAGETGWTAVRYVLAEED